MILEDAGACNCARPIKCQQSCNVFSTVFCYTAHEPAYSPNPNLLERLWRFVKKPGLYFKYYADFPTFIAAIGECLNQTRTTQRAALDLLLMLHFQLFEKAQ